MLCTCMYVGMYVRACTYVCVYMNVHVVCMYVYVCMYVCTLYVCVCICMYHSTCSMYVCMYVCMYICTYVLVSHTKWITYVCPNFPCRAASFRASDPKSLSLSSPAAPSPSPRFLLFPVCRADMVSSLRAAAKSRSVIRAVTPLVPVSWQNKNKHKKHKKRG